MDNMTTVNILTNLKESGYMGRSVNEALQYAIDCVLYVVRVQGEREYFERNFMRGDECDRS